MFSSPNINTDIDVVTEYLPFDALESATISAANTYVEIQPAQPAYMHMPFMQAPGTPRHSGWMEQQLPFEGVTWVSVDAPMILEFPVDNNSQFNVAAHPVPTFGATGVTGPLRSPGINEGY